MRRLMKFLVLLVLPFGYIELAHGQSEVLGSSNAIVYDVKLIQDKKILIANLVDKIELWNYETKNLISSWNTSRIVAIDYYKDNLAGVSKSGDLVIWDISTGKASLQLNVSTSPLICVAWIDSVFIAVGSDNGDLLKINTVSGEIIAKAKNPVAITAMALGQDNMLITGDESGILTIYDAKDLQLKTATKGHKRWIRDIVTSDSNQTFVTTADDGDYKKWKSVHQIISVDDKAMGNWLMCADFLDYSNSNSNFVAFGKRNGTIEIFTGFGKYKYNLNTLVNSIDIVESKLPIIVLAVATYGKGIHLLSAVGMELRTK